MREAFGDGQGSIGSVWNKGDFSVLDTLISYAADDKVGHRRHLIDTDGRTDRPSTGKQLTFSGSSVVRMKD